MATQPGWPQAWLRQAASGAAGRAFLSQAESQCDHRKGLQKGFHSQLSSVSLFSESQLAATVQGT